jgi:hypothetical protein
MLLRRTLLLLLCPLLDTFVILAGLALAVSAKTLLELFRLELIVSAFELDNVIAEVSFCIIFSKRIC